MNGLLKRLRSLGVSVGLAGALACSGCWGVVGGYVEGSQNRAGMIEAARINEVTSEIDVTYGSAQVKIRGKIVSCEKGMLNLKDHLLWKYPEQWEEGTPFCYEGKYDVKDGKLINLNDLYKDSNPPPGWRPER